MTYVQGAVQIAGAVGGLLVAGAAACLLLQLARAAGHLVRHATYRAELARLEAERAKELAPDQLAADRAALRALLELDAGQEGQLREAAVQIGYHRELIRLYREFRSRFRWQEHKPTYEQFIQIVRRNRPE